eukprot:TRINITY_DN15545_c0_g1_i2.p3 TRINITY_DN15545_c0_g1~~TRINITY_DN15545_c0_g1_i2.p3  ORF type:complete len:138 (+),score=22.05 TRINITY_DN15545_c0_g1_i2:52-465(+)
MWKGEADLGVVTYLLVFFFFFSSRRRHTRCREVSWARRCVQETGQIYSRTCLTPTHTLYFAIIKSTTYTAVSKFSSMLMYSYMNSFIFNNCSPNSCSTYNKCQIIIFFSRTKPTFSKCCTISIIFYSNTQPLSLIHI